MSVQIIRGNALDLPLADDSVDLIVTSPPYFGLRSYQDGGEHYDGQIGAEATPANHGPLTLADLIDAARNHSCIDDRNDELDAEGRRGK